MRRRGASPGAPPPDGGEAVELSRSQPVQGPARDPSPGGSAAQHDPPHLPTVTASASTETRLGSKRLDRRPLEVGQQAARCSGVTGHLLHGDARSCTRESRGLGTRSAAHRPGRGGTDLPLHYVEHGGFVVSAAIDRRVRIARLNRGAKRFRLEHLELEEVDDPAEIRHPILRAAIARHWNGRPLHLTSEGDVPPGTGLGSSGSYAVCAVKALELAAGRDLAPTDLAEAACTIEIDDLGRTVGKQDQYAAAFGA